MEEDRIGTLRRTLNTMHGIRFAYLFGRRINGGAGNLSDFGVAVYLNDRRPGFGRRVEVIEELADALGATDFDFVVLNDAPILTNRIIAREGVVIKEDAPAREAFQARLRRIDESLVPSPEIPWPFFVATEAADNGEGQALTPQS